MKSCEKSFLKNYFSRNKQGLKGKYFIKNYFLLVSMFSNLKKIHKKIFLEKNYDFF
jgi:hypothetical protein